MNESETGRPAEEAASTAFASGADAMRDKMTQATAQGDAAFKAAAERSMQALGELNAQSKSNLEAVMASVTAATRGAESLGSQAMVYAKASVEQNVAAAKAMTSARSMQEIVELQTSFTRKAMEAYVSELTKASEKIASVMQDTMKPLNERAAAAVESVQSAR